MTEALLPIGILIILFVIIFGLAVYFLVASILTVKKNQRRIKIQEQQLLKSTKGIEEKRARLEELLKKIRKTGRKLGRISQVKQLKNELREEHKKGYELEMEIKRLKHNIKVETSKQEVKKSITQTPETDDIETRKIKQKYPALPKNQLERIEIERSVARSLMRNNGGSFHISQILRAIENLYPKHINPNGRVMLLNEIKNWIDRDPLCKAVKTADKIQYYTFI